MQFYPENSAQMELLTTQAMKAGFYGGVVVDYPNSTKAKKFFLVLMTGGNVPLPKALGTDEDSHGRLLPCFTKRYKKFHAIKHTFVIGALFNSCILPPKFEFVVF